MRHGRIQGADVVTLRREAEGAGALASMMPVASEAPGVTRAQLWTASESQTPRTAVAQIRPGADALITEAVVAEFLRLPDATAFADRLAREHASLGEIGVYSHLCSLHREGAPS